MKTARFFTSAICCLLIFAAGVVRAADEKEKGTPEAPSSAKVIAGTYYRGDGLGYNISLTLSEDGKYTAEWHGCVGKYGEASGKWGLNDKQITLTPSKEEGMMKGHLQTLDVMKFRGDWILVPTAKGEREFYDKWGVERSSCFQKREKIK
jgi:hypothetical protein